MVNFDIKVLWTLSPCSLIQ